MTTEELAPLLRKSGLYVVDFQLPKGGLVASMPMASERPGRPHLPVWALLQYMDLPLEDVPLALASLSDSPILSAVLRARLEGMLP